MSESSDRRIRLMQPEDRPFVFSSFIRSYSHSEEAEHHTKDAFCALIHRRMEVLMGRGNIHVMCGVPDDDWIFGWLLSEVDPKGGYTLHYALTKRAHRGEKVFSQLLQHSLPAGAPSLSFTHSTTLDPVLQRWGFTYKPWTDDR